MQRNRFGIPVNVPKHLKSQQMKQIKQSLDLDAQFFPQSYDHYSELSGTENGLQVHIIVPTATKDFKQLIKEGYKLVKQWTCDTNQFKYIPVEEEMQ